MGCRVTGQEAWVRAANAGQLAREARARARPRSLASRMVLRRRTAGPVTFGGVEQMAVNGGPDGGDAVRILGLGTPGPLQSVALTVAQTIHQAALRMRQGEASVPIGRQLAQGRGGQCRGGR